MSERGRPGGDEMCLKAMTRFESDQVVIMCVSGVVRLLHWLAAVPVV